MHNVAVTLNKIRAELQRSFLEREEAIHAMLLALLAGEHIILLGDPGVAKSEMVRFLVSALDNKSYFEALLSKNRPAEAVLGPLDIKRFRETGERIVRNKGFLTDVDLAFLDEIGKMSPVVGHDLLAALNERIRHEVNGGRSVHQIPLHTAFTAANEIPTHESDDAAALWDRLLVRVFVDDIRKKQNFAKLLTMEVNPPTTRLDFEELKKAAEVDVPAIGLSKLAEKAIVELRMKLADEKVNPSARRWRKSMKLLRAEAFLAGADEVLEEHLSVLKFTLWDEIEHIEVVTQRCESAANPFYDRVQEQLKLLGEVQKGIKDRAGDTTGLATYGQEASTKLAQVRKSLDQLIMDADGRTIPGFVGAADKHRELLIKTFVDCMGQDADVAEISAEKRLGLGGGSDFQTVVG